MVQGFVAALLVVVELTLAAREGEEVAEPLEEALAHANKEGEAVKQDVGVGEEHSLTLFMPLPLCALLPLEARLPVPLAHPVGVLLLLSVAVKEAQDEVEGLVDSLER